MKYKAFLWDNDGVICNSNIFHEQGYRDISKKYYKDINYTSEQHATLLGVNTHDTFVAILEMNGKGDIIHLPETQKIINEMEELKKQDFQTRCENVTEEVLFKGMKEVLKAAYEAGLINIITSSSSSARVMLERAGAIKYIHYVVDTARGSVDCITETAIKNNKIPGKPAPDLFEIGFMRASEILPGLKKEEVLGFEDATNGVAAIKGAGIDALYIGDVNHPSNKEAFEKKFKVQPDYIVEHSSQITLKKLEELINEKEVSISL